MLHEQRQRWTSNANQNRIAPLKFADGRRVEQVQVSAKKDETDERGKGRKMERDRKKERGKEKERKKRSRRESERTHEVKNIGGGA